MADLGNTRVFGDLTVSNKLRVLDLARPDNTPVVWGDRTITAGAGLSGGGTLGGNITLSHSDTSSQLNINNSGRTYIQSIELDTYGHITKINSATDADTYTGTVKSVSMSVPTGLSVTGSPITTSGTLALSLTSGYSIPTTIKQGQWDTAYSLRHSSGSDNQTITSGNGMNFTSGSGNVTIALGTPAGLTASTTNTLTTTSHTHSIATATAVGLSNASVSGAGTSTSLARADHTHAITGFLTGNQTITLSGDATGTGTTAIAVTVANDSHTHDTRYYTESESDGRFVNITGDTMTGDLTINGALYATSKSFRIPHPTKEGKNITYGSLEGPENGVYVRGKSNERMIRLPDYWEHLVDKDTITVQLTPIGKHQKLIVGEIGNTFVEVLNKKLFSKRLNYYYFIQAERKDIPKLEVEK